MAAHPLRTAVDSLSALSASGRSPMELRITAPSSRSRRRHACSAHLVPSSPSRRLLFFRHVPASVSPSRPAQPGRANPVRVSPIHPSLGGARNCSLHVLANVSLSGQHE